MSYGKDEKTLGKEIHEVVHEPRRNDNLRKDFREKNIDMRK